MDPRNKAFVGAVQVSRKAFIELIWKAKVGDIIYPSTHFFERVVERNLEAVDILRMLVPVIRDFRATTFNDRTYCVRWREFSLFAKIDFGCVTQKRKLVLKTIYDRDVDESSFDVVVRM